MHVRFISLARKLTPADLTRFFISSAVVSLILYIAVLVISGSPITLSNPARARCCISSTSGRDLCGLPNCIPCASWSEPRIPVSPTPGSDVFFHETSFSTVLNARQSCAVESVALTNPSLSVILLTTNQLEDTPLTGVLKSYPNIRIERIDLNDYFMGTPLQDWYFCSGRLQSPYAVSHLSDALRFLTLYKYGGYYFDLDIVMLKSVELLRNFTGAESSSHLAVGAMHFDVSHPVIAEAVKEFADNYKPYDWGANGPKLLTRVLLRRCGLNSVTDLWNSHCPGVVVYAPHYFYPIPWGNWNKYFVLDKNSDVPDVLYGSYAAHVWNKLSSSATVNRGSNQIYAKLAARFCPKVNAVAGDTF